MDFLKIRKKARERAAAGRAREGTQGAAPPAEPALTREVLEGELAARLQGLPPPAAERFTTWRPGSGEPPRLDAPPEPPPSRDALAAPAPRGTLRGVGAPPGEEPAPRDPLDEFLYREDEEAPAIPAFGTTAASADAEASGARAEYLTFLLGGETYAAPIERVREVLKAPPVTEVPRAPAHVVGVVTVRGEVVAVCDPRRRLELPAAPVEGQATRLVVVDAGEGPCALLVDAVADVVRLPPHALEPCPQGIGGAGADCLAGIGRDGDRLFTVLDLAALLRRAPAPRRGADPTPSPFHAGEGLAGADKDDRRAGP